MRTVNWSEPKPLSEFKNKSQRIKKWTFRPH